MITHPIAFEWLRNAGNGVISSSSNFLKYPQHALSECVMDGFAKQTK